MRFLKMSEIKVFNRWPAEGIEVKDAGLKDYICLEPKIVPKTGARYAKFRFHKSKVFIVERFMNKLMIPGHKSGKHNKTSGFCTGKANTAYKLTYDTFRIIEQKTKENPIKVLVKAVENGSPREEIVTIEYGGAKYPKATECGPQRRIDIALRNITQGAYASSFDKKMISADALAAELIEASKMSAVSNAISKKRDLERQCDASR
jgi:small subunit ribosomal protein S7